MTSTQAGDGVLTPELEAIAAAAHDRLRMLVRIWPQPANHSGVSPRRRSPQGRREPR
jgi:hypothetical protein